MAAPDFAGLHWRKSSYSNGGGECVEVADLPDNGMGVRDSKLGEQSPIFTLSRAGWIGLLDAVKAGRTTQQ